MQHLTKKRVMCNLLASFIVAFAFYHIHYQNQLIETGFIGIGFIVNKFFNISPALVSFVLDILFLSIGRKMFGQRLWIYTILNTTSFTLFYLLISRYSPFHFHLQNHLWFAAVIGGIAVGFGVGLSLRVGGSTGGEEICSLMISKYIPIPVGTSLFLVELSILFLCAFYIEPKEIGYTLIYLVVCTKITNMMTKNTFKKKSIQT
jgi:uncharacterized membrane-anchored protein YitT (DUF2179 family)